MNEHVISRLEAIQSALMAHHHGGAGLPNAHKGSEREDFLRQFLTQIFPLPYRFSSGSITDSDGYISGQIDIAIEYPFLPSFPMPGGNQRLLLSESVAAVIEVKSNLSSQWSQIEATTKKVKQLRRRWHGSTSMDGGKILMKGPHKSQIPVVAVGYTGFTHPAGLVQRHSDTPKESRPDIILVLESGACFDGNNTGMGPKGLFFFCTLLSKLVRAVSSANADPVEYLLK